MEEKKKLVLPGDFLANGEEFEAGSNTYSENDETHSATYGEVESKEGTISVQRRGKSVKVPEIGMHLLCLVTRADPNKAKVGCMLESEVDKKERCSEIVGILPVTNISRARVETIRDAVRVGDIIKARIYKMRENGDAEISILGKEFGVLKAYCSKCRKAMDLKGNIFICNNCNRRERRKIPGAEGDFGSGERRRGPPRDRREGGRRSFGNRRSFGPRDKNLQRRK
jgi:exosome complex component CSL4